MRRAAVLIGLILFTSCGGDSPPDTAPTTTAVVDVPAVLLATVCEGKPAFCIIDDSVPGLVQFEMQVPKVAGLVAAGQQTGLWTAADAALMTQTSQADGPQTASTGKVTWTFEVVHGLHLNIDVS